MKLAGKVAVVTGGAKGIGAAIAKRLQADGAAVVSLDNSYASPPKDALNEAAGVAPGQGSVGPQIVSFKCNVTDRNDVSESFRQIVGAYGKIDILVNNAGITRDKMFHKMSDEEWDVVIRVNLTGTANCTKAVITGMREQNYGKIVNLTSVSAFGNLGQTNYAASKAGVIGFTKSLAKEAARKNITVNAVAPSYVDTEMLRAVPEQVLDRFVSSIPLGRLARPDEIASVVSFLASDESSFITGECITVSGGSYT